MAEYLHFSRDSKLYMEKDGKLWSIPVLDGFSFSQATNSSEITLNEMEDSSGRSRRGRKMFTDSLAPAEWSFSTYIRPFKSVGSKSNTNGVADSNLGGGNHHHAVEEALWVAMAGQNVYLPTTGKFKHGAKGGAITSFVTTSGGTDSDDMGNDRTAGTYNIAIPTVAATSPTAHNQALVAAGAGTLDTGSGAVIQVVVSAGGVATATITERGIGFDSGNTITIGSQLLGGDASGDNLVLTTTSESISSDATDMDINFFDSNRAALGTFNLYFVLSNESAGRLIYKLDNAVVNEASMDFDIDGIASISWSGMAATIKEVATGLGAGQVTASPDTPTADVAGALWVDTNDNDKLHISTTSGSLASSWYANISEGSTSTSNFIRNRLTNLTLAPDADFKIANPSYQAQYSLAITGGNVTISNNISYLTPEELGKVNQPIEHVTGTRTVGGSFNCYLASSDAATNKSKNLFADLVSDTTSVINKFGITLQVGGTDTTKPRFVIDIPAAHIEVPTHSIEDVISMEATFSGLGSGVGEGDEISLKYIGV